MHKLLTFFIAVVWLINGLFCKLLNLVPRHQLIVSRLLGEEHAVFFTKAIGVAELLMMVWILSSVQSRWCAITQIFVIALMNVIEFALVPDLLLFGRRNALFAFLLVALIYYNEFILAKTSS